MIDNERESLVKKSLVIFALLFLVIGASLGGMIAVFYQFQIQSYDQQLCTEERHSVGLQLAVVEDHFSSILTDLDYLARQGILKVYLEKATPEYLGYLGSEYLNYSASKKIYDQIRYLDENGQEVVRVNYNDGVPGVVAPEKLQNKSGRYYFTDALRLQRGEIFVSPLDLNVEAGVVEIPFKPMIRFGTPVFDQTGSKRGIVLLNYFGQDILDLIQGVSSVAHGQTMLLNAAGYWLHHPDDSREWGFMFADKSELSFAAQSPEVWAQIQRESSGQIRTSAGIYTFATLNLIDSESEAMRVDDHFWVIVSFISADTLASYSKGLSVRLFIFGAALFLLATITAWFLAMAITRRKLFQAQLIGMAYYDKLTGLPNRKLFFDRMEQALALVKRHERKCALLFIDLDGFKQVNDTLGHAAGDELLIGVGERMNCCCRTSDTVARLGGDEFAVLLADVTCAAGARAATEKIISEIQKPFILKQGAVTVGASIGIAMFPTHGTTLDSLLTNADNAMYVSKNRGKNTYTFAEESDAVG